MGASRRRTLRCVLWFSLLSLIPFLYIEITQPVRYVFRHSNVSGSCIIPELNPYDPSVMQYMWQPQPLVCDNSPVLIHVDDNGVLQYNDSALKQMDIEKVDLRCKYRIILRNSDDVTISFGDPVSFTPPHQLEADFIHLLCTNKRGKSVLDKLVTNVAKDHVKRTVPVEADSPKQLSVILFGIDSVSRSAAIRKLPKTVRYLTEELKSYDFKGYMKVGENTLPNLISLLTGLRCWSDELPFPASEYATKPYDSFPLLWQNFSDKGYATFYAEDMPDINTFNYLTRGFVNQPTHHYMRPFWLGLNKDEVGNGKLRQVFQFLENQKVNIKKGSSMCYKDTPRHLVQINYLKQFIQRYKNQRRFALSFLVELSHEYQNFLAYGDNDIVDFLKWFKRSGHLNTSVLVLFSDHGSRIETIRGTAIGRIEDRMPMLHIVFPPSFKVNYPNIDQALRENINRLTTAFDVHQTLLDVLAQNFEKPSKSFVENRERGISLFQPLPTTRSCADAWVPEHYCPCYTFVPVDINNNLVVDLISSKFMTDLNRRFQHLPECTKLRLAKVRDVRKVTQALEYIQSERTGLTGLSVFRFFQPEAEQSIRYEISVEAFPSQGIFEATYNVKGGREITLIGDIVRTNRYGDQSDCITDKILKPLCFCKHHIQTTDTN